MPAALDGAFDGVLDVRARMMGLRDELAAEGLPDEPARAAIAALDSMMAELGMLAAAGRVMAVLGDQAALLAKEN